MIVSAFHLSARSFASVPSRLYYSTHPRGKSQSFNNRFAHSSLFTSVDSQSQNSRKTQEKSTWKIVFSKLLALRHKYRFSKRVSAARVLLGVLIFLTGYRMGVANNTAAAGISRSGKILAKVTSPRRYALLSTMLTVLVARDVWRSIPRWAKPAIIQRSIADTRRLLGLKATTGSVSSSSGNNELSDLSMIAKKMNGVLKVVQRRLPPDSLEGVNLQASFLVLLGVLQDLKEQRAHERDELYASSDDITETEIPLSTIEGLDKWMDLADAAYNDFPNGLSLKEYLEEKGYDLIKHDTTVLPGYLGHYVAIHQSEKEAIIGIKGTSNLEDLITDMCGAAISYPLEESFVVSADGPTSIRAHEGILLSTERLADDLQSLIEKLLIPQDYKIIVVGHSLGAASAALLAVLLRSRLPLLQDPILTVGETSTGDNHLPAPLPRLKVYAFGSPPTLDLSSALACKSFVTTVVNNCDFVTRSNAGPVLVTVEVLRSINEKLQERAGGKSVGVAFTLNLLKQLSQDQTKAEDNGIGTQMLSSKEFTRTIDKALEKVGTDDADQLFVPGRVILMYNLWEKEARFKKMRKILGNPDKGRNYDFSADRVVLTKPTAKALRFIDFDGRMLEDHMPPSYKSSLRALCKSKDIKTQQ